MQITELDAGQDLDVLVAEQVLHWRIVDAAPFAASYDAATNVLTYGRWAVPGVSTNLLDTWLIVEHIGPQYLDWLTYRGDRYYAKIKGHIGEGRTPFRGRYFTPRWPVGQEHW
jgi:hypothetical protein